MAFFRFDRPRFRPLFRSRIGRGARIGRGVCLAGLILFHASGCGFQPLYGQRLQTRESNPWLGRIDVARIDDREGQLMRNALWRELAPYGQESPALFSLRCDLAESLAELDIKKDDSSTYRRKILTLQYTLTRLEDNTRLLSGSIQSSGSYNVVDSTYANLQADVDVEERTIIDLAREVKTRLSLFFAGRSSDGSAIRSTVPAP